MFDCIKQITGEEMNMADTVKNMDKKFHSKNIFSGLTLPDGELWKPLSQLPQSLQHDPNDSLSKAFNSPFGNFQIAIPNDSRGKKRKLDDSNINTDASSVLKKPCCLNGLSPDLGCFVDCSSPLSGRCSASLFVSSHFRVNESTPARRSEIKKTLSSRLDLEHEKCGLFGNQAGEVEAVVLSRKSKNHLINISHDFDCEVDENLCLNPLKKEDQEEMNKEANTDLRALEEDKGYDSSVHPNENEEEHNTESPPESQCQEQASVCVQQFSFLNKDCSTSVSQPQSERVKSVVEFLECEDDVLIIGEPIFESSVCQPSAAEEQRSCLSVLKESVSACRAYNDEDSTVDTSYEVTLPLQVQVKSKVVVPELPESISKPASYPQKQNSNSANQNRNKTLQRAKCARSQRFQVHNDEMELEQQKRQYVFSVRSHMTENQVAPQGYMTELRDLMTHVAGQTGSNGSGWQHPSDLTSRNYQWRFGNRKPSMTLREWKAKNFIHHKRFCKVPKIFK